MRIKTFVFALSAILSFAASADNYIINQAYEVSVDELILPSSAAGNISFRGCKTCERKVVRVTSDTRYVLNKRNVSLVDLQRATSLIADKKTNIATVIHHLESDTILSVHVYE